MSATDELVGNRLRELRRKAYMGVNEVAHALGTDSDGLHRLEAGEQRATPEQLQTLRRLYRTTLADIYADARAGATQPGLDASPPIAKA